MSHHYGVRLASPGDRPAVEKLLRAGFGDEEEFLCAFFDFLYPTCKTILATDGEEIAATATLIPCQVMLPGAPAQDALYLYSLTTLPAFRGRGHAQRLLDYAKGECERVFLHAADDSLFSMYAARGWRGMMHARWMELPAQEQAMTYHPRTGNDYRSLRAQYLKDKAYIEWHPETYRFLNDLLYFGLGGLFESENALVAVLNHEDSCLYVAEALGKDALGLSQHLAYLCHCERVKILMPCTADAPGAFPYAQGVGASIPDPIHLSFVFL